MDSHIVYHCQWWLSVRDREKGIETGDGQMNRTRERESLWRLFTENTKILLNVILHHVRDDSGFSRPNVGRYVTTAHVNIPRHHLPSSEEFHSVVLEKTDK